MLIERDTFKKDEFYFFAIDECTCSADWSSVVDYYPGHFDADLMYFGIFKATEDTINKLVGLDIEEDVAKIKEVVKASYNSFAPEEKRFADTLLDKAVEEYQNYYWG